MESLADKKGDNIMNLKVLGANKTEVSIGTHLILFSYETPVACLEAKSGEAFKTSKTWSNTTTRHINSWIASLNVHVSIKPQDFFDSLVKGA